jgi:hypothetical protein
MLIALGAIVVLVVILIVVYEKKGAEQSAPD